MSNKNLNKQSANISTMFNSIAPSYDKLNHILSLNIDKLWRRKMANYLAKNRGENMRVLDIACGTGDSSITLYKRGFNVIGIDIAEEMLNIAKRKNATLKLYKNLALPEYILANADSLPFKDNSFFAVTISFGIRNFENREKALKEIYRVLQPGGILAILEFAKPRNRVVLALYNLYFNNILPIVGRLISKNKRAYNYLAESVEDFPKYEQFCSEIASCSYNEVKYKELSLGVALLYTAKK